MTPEWLAEHKGRFLRRQAMVWWCGDYDCDCTQAQVYDVWENSTDRRFIVTTPVWEGTFHSGEGWDEGDSAALELAAYRDSLTPEEREKITWELT